MNTIMLGEGRIETPLSTLGEPMSKENNMDNFERFWNTWPKSFRKGGKSACRVKWKKFYCETCADQIIKHIEWMKTTDAWRKDDGAFIPAPLVYLNQQRWDGAEIPAAPANAHPSEFGRQVSNLITQPGSEASAHDR